jgi:hypothetical protein
MLTDRKEREDYMMLFREQEADTDAHRYEGQRILLRFSNRTGGRDRCSQYKIQRRLLDVFYRTGG